MATFLTAIRLQISTCLSDFISVFTNTRNAQGHVFWFIIGIIIFDMVLNITMQLMGNYNH